MTTIRGKQVVINPVQISRNPLEIFGADQFETVL
jgi:hypothetical protein